MSEERELERTRIYTHMTRSAFLHVEDALAIGKLRLFVGKYRRGQGAEQMAFHFLDVDDARVLLADLSWGKAVDFADFKGTSNGDGPQSRVLKVKTNEDKVWLEIQNGPGEVVGQGAVKPKGKPDSSVSIPFTVWEARKFAHAVLAYVQAWGAGMTVAGKIMEAMQSQSPTLSRAIEDYVRTYGTPERKGQPEQRRAGAKSQRPEPAPAQQPAGAPQPAPQEPSPEDSHECPASAQGRQASTTAFWTEFNAKGKPVGIVREEAAGIVNASGGDWDKAIARLEAMIAERVAL